MKINLKNFNLSLSFSSVALLAFIVVSNFYTGYLLSFASILIHETGHLIAMFICRRNPDGLEVSAFDIRIIKNQNFTLKFSENVFISSSGPLMNFIWCLLFFKTHITFAYVNLFIGLFNLLPASTLDGGQLLFLFLSRKLTPDLSCKIVDAVTIIISFPLFIVGILVLLNSKYNFSLLIISIYLILSLFMKKDKIC